jgi:hypothetical protein
MKYKIPLEAMGGSRESISVYDRIKDVIARGRFYHCHKYFIGLLRLARGSQAFDLQLEVLELRLDSMNHDFIGG